MKTMLKHTQNSVIILGPVVLHFIKAAIRAEIHQALLSQFSLQAKIFIKKLLVKD